MKETKSKQRYSWTKQEDDALIYIKQVLKVKRWSEVARKLMQIHNEHERKDKHCRDRYENFLVKKEERKKAWTSQDEVKTIQYYMQYGNKWSQIATLFDGTNGIYIKNKFYSRMRKGIRTINYLMDAFFMRNWKQLQLDVIFKLVTCSTEKFDLNPKNPISKRVEKKVTFVEQIIYKVFMLSFVDKSRIKKSPRQSKQNTVSPGYINGLVEQINFIDENMEKKRTNKTNPQPTQGNIRENKQNENLQHENNVNLQFHTKLDQESLERESYLDIIHGQRQDVNYQFLNLSNFCADKVRINKRIEVIAANSFQRHYQNWINSDFEVKEQNYGENRYQGIRNKKMIGINSTNQLHSKAERIICSYRPIYPGNLWRQIQESQLLQQKQNEKKWHNSFSSDEHHFIG